MSSTRSSTVGHKDEGGNFSCDGPVTDLKKTAGWLTANCAIAKPWTSGKKMAVEVLGEMAHGEGHRRGSFFPLGFDAPVDMVDAALLLLLTDCFPSYYTGKGVS